MSPLRPVVHSQAEEAVTRLGHKVGVRGDIDHSWGHTLFQDLKPRGLR